MHRSVKELKRLARQNLAGNYKIPMRAALMVTLLPALIQIPFTDMLSEGDDLLSAFLYYGAEFLIGIVTYVLYSGETMIHMCICRRQKYQPQDLFYCFRYAADHYCIASILRYLVHLIAFLPLSSAIILATYVYDEVTPELTLLLAALVLAGLVLDAITDVIFGMFYYVVLDEEDARVRENLDTALSLIGGNRMRFLGLILSFAGMDLLVVLTMGIGALWVTPYRLQSMALFYMDLTQDACLAEV